MPVPRSRTAGPATVTSRTPTLSRRLAAALAGLAVLTVTVLAALAGPEDLVRSLRQADLRALLAAVVVQATALSCLAALYRSAHRTVGGPATDPGAGRVGLAAFGLTQALPGGGAAGGLLAMRRLQQLGSSPVAAASTVVHVGMLSLLGLCLVVTLAASLAALATGQHVGYAVLGLALTGAIAGGFAAVRRQGFIDRAQQALLERLQETSTRSRSLPAHWLDDLRDGAHELVPTHRLAGPFGWSVAKWSLDLVALTLVVQAVGGDVALAGIALSYAAVNLLNSIPVTPGGVGLVEGGITAGLVGFGLDLGTATAAAITYRAVSYWLPLLGSVPVAIAQLAASRAGSQAVGVSTETHSMTSSVCAPATGQARSEAVREDEAPSPQPLLDGTPPASEGRLRGPAAVGLAA